MCHWKSELNDHYLCRVPAIPGQELCLLHSLEDKDPDAFLLELQRQIDGLGVAEARNPAFDFTGYCFPVGICIGSHRLPSRRVVLPERIEGDLMLTEAIVRGRVGLEGARIRGTLDCERLQVSERFYATRCRVSGDVNLRGATIGGTIHLGSGRIRGDLLCRALVVRGDLYMFGLHVGGDAYLHELVVDGTVHLDKAQVSGALDASQAHIGARWLSREARVEGKVDFSSAEVAGVFEFGESSVLQDASFERATFLREASFESADFHKKVSFAGSRFLSAVQFEACQAHGVFLGMERPTIFPLARNRMGLEMNDPAGSESFWRFTRICFGKTGENARADAAHYFERVWRLKAAWKTRPSVGVLLRYAADVVFIRTTSAYGTSIPRALASWAGIQGGFAAIYALNPGLLARASQPTWSAQNWLESLCFSVATFATFGIGDVVPGSRIGAAVVATEAALGAIAFAGMVVILMRKLVR